MATIYTLWNWFFNVCHFFSFLSFFCSFAWFNFFYFVFPALFIALVIVAIVEITYLFIPFLFFVFNKHTVKLFVNATEVYGGMCLMFYFDKWIIFIANFCKFSLLKFEWTFKCLFHSQQNYIICHMKQIQRNCICKSQFDWLIDRTFCLCSSKVSDIKKQFRLDIHTNGKDIYLR